ncbi:S1 family peptidase [Leucobacter musarum]|uniref:S1 family peptidase n=1 Tax=Leucobacter musarum TaxID=1930747 RepID=UPI0006A767DB|nr:trypsin-like serine protease [Leucobacter musarum]
MKILFRTVTTAALCAVVLLTAQPAFAVAGGTEATEPYPFMGAYKPGYPVPPGAGGNGCGVSVIDATWAVTAAHCLKNNHAANGSPQGWTVQVGSTDVTHGGTEVPVQRFFRLTTGLPFGKDLMLLQLRDAVDVEPIALASKTPLVGTPVRFLGWGSTCDEFSNGPECYPAQLREGDGVIRPLADCPESLLEDAELCVGASAGAHTGNADSGGPLLVQEDGEWKLAGVLSGPANDPTIAGVYTDITIHADWVRATMRDSASLVDDDVVPDMAGYPDFDGCMGSVVRSAASVGSDPAMLLTNGHCVQMFGADLAFPEPGTALVDQPTGENSLMFLDGGGYGIFPAHADRVIYATMTGTDVAVLRLDQSYDEIERQGGRVLSLATSPVEAGVSLSLKNGTGQTCEIEAIVPQLREGSYTMEQSLRFAQSDECLQFPGQSGAALVASDGHTLAAVLNTHNRDGESCTDNNPCEVAADGTTTVFDGRGYGQQVAGVNACLAAGSVLDQSAANCAVTGATSTSESVQPGSGDVVATDSGLTELAATGGSQIQGVLAAGLVLLALAGAIAGGVWIARSRGRRVAE